MERRPQVHPRIARRLGATTTRPLVGSRGYSEARAKIDRVRTKFILGAALLLALAFVGLLTLGLSRRPAPPEPGDRAPRFAAPLLGGEGSFALERTRGRPVLLNFWASWCAPCKDEAPYLRRAHELYGDRVEFVGIDVKDARSDAISFARRHGLDYTHVRDTGEIYSTYGLSGQPESFLIDDQGVVLEHVRGPFLDERHLFGILDVLLARDA